MVVMLLPEETLPPYHTWHAIRQPWEVRLYSSSTPFILGQHYRTTELWLRVVAECLRERQREAIQVLARKHTPVFPCDACGKEATYVCAQCIYDDQGWLCDACVSEH